MKLLTRKEVDQAYDIERKLLSQELDHVFTYQQYIQYGDDILVKRLDQNNFTFIGQYPLEQSEQTHDQFEVIATIFDWDWKTKELFKRIKELESVP